MRKQILNTTKSTIFLIFIITLTLALPGSIVLASTGDYLLERITEAENKEEIAELTHQAFQHFMEEYPERLDNSINPQLLFGCTGGGCLRPVGEEGFYVIVPFEEIAFTREGDPVAFMAVSSPETRSGFFLISLNSGGEEVSYINRNGETVSTRQVALHTGNERISVTPIPIPDPERISLTIEEPQVSMVETREDGVSIWIGERRENGLYYGVNLISVMPEPIP
ncbi:hypothetical protein KGY77_10730 [Candidatus Bipolaricaulota bacterium]|nr:hypothetical protein [Candidatus Bipolaricaulota bacterium]